MALCFRFQIIVLSPIISIKVIFTKLANSNYPMIRNILLNNSPEELPNALHVQVLIYNDNYIL